MGRARRDHLGENDEQEREGEPPPERIELRFVYTPAHAELQFRHSSGEAWKPVPYVRADEAPASETIEGEAVDVSDQPKLEAPAEQEAKE